MEDGLEIRHKMDGYDWDWDKGGEKDIQKNKMIQKGKVKFKYCKKDVYQSPDR